MDERTFQHELQQINEQVSAMWNRHNSMQPPSAPAIVTASSSSPQTLDVTSEHATYPAQPDMIQTDVATPHGQRTSRKEYSHPVDAKLHVPDTEGVSSTTFTCPSIGQKVKPSILALRKDMFDLERRITQLEHDAFGLKDGDGNESPRQYTPSSSVGSFDGSLHRLRSDQYAISDFSPFQTEMTPAAQQTLHTEPVLMPGEATNIISKPPTPAWHGQADQGTSCCCRPDISNVEHGYSEQIEELRNAVVCLQRTNQTPAMNDPRNEESSKRNPTASKCTGISLLRTELSSTRDSLYQHIHSVERQHHKDITDLYKEVVGMQRTYNVRTEQKQSQVFLDGRSAHQPQTGPESIAFRDKEIARLDELLRNAQEHIRSTEQHFAEKEEAATVFATKHEQCDVRTDNMLSNMVQKHRALVSTRRDLAAKEAEIRELHSTLDSRNRLLGAWSRSYKELEQEMRDCQSDRDDAVQHARKLTRILREIEDRNDGYTTSRTEEIDRLHEFCREKDMIADKQEAIIARGAALLEQRDNETEDLTQRLRAVEQEMDDEHARNVTLKMDWEQTNKALTTMESEILNVCERPKIFAGFGTEVVDLQRRLADIKKLADDIHTTSSIEGRDDDTQPASLESQRPNESSYAQEVPEVGQPLKMWSPQPITGFNDVADEVRRASIWASQHLPHVFGQPGVIGSSEQGQGRRSRVDDDARYRKSKQWSKNSRGPTQPGPSSGAVTLQPGAEGQYQQGAGRDVDRLAPLGPHDTDVTPQWTSMEAGGSEKTSGRQQHQRRDQPTGPLSALPFPADAGRLQFRSSHAELRREQPDENVPSISRHESVPESSRRVFQAATVESDPESKGGE